MLTVFSKRKGASSPLMTGTRAFVWSASYSTVNDSRYHVPLVVFSMATVSAVPSQMK